MPAATFAETDDELATRFRQPGLREAGGAGNESGRVAVLTSKQSLLEGDFGVTAIANCKLQIAMQPHNLQLAIGKFAIGVRLQSLP